MRMLGQARLAPLLRGGTQAVYRVRNAQGFAVPTGCCRT